MGSTDFILGAMLMGIVGIMSSDADRIKMKSLETRISNFPSEVQEMKRIEMDGNHYTSEYVVKVPIGQDTNVTKWVYLKEYDPEVE